jgi:hydrogenase maturation protease
VLVLGYGNALRGDDAVGWHAVARLAGDPRLGGVRVSWQHQLTPELAHEFGVASLVVLVDAEAGARPGAVVVRRLAPGAVNAQAFSHHVTPESLLALAGVLYGASPDAWVVGVGIAQLDLGEGLSPPVEAAIPAVVDAVAGIVEAHLDA